MAIAIQYAPTTYQDMSYDDLVTYAVYRLVNSHKEATFENIVAEAFTLFPSKFGLRGYPQWPDSAVVNKSWLRCRTDKQYMVGSVKEGFQLTPRGYRVAEQVEQSLHGNGGQVPSHKTKSETRTRAGRLLRAIEASPLFKYYQESHKLGQVIEEDLADLLLLLPDSPTHRFKSNLEQFKDAARLYDRQDVLAFLAALALRFPHKFSLADVRSHA